MTWTVSYLPVAIGELADLWRTALDRRAVTESSDRIDQLLTVDPHQRGMAFHNHRILLVPPLVIAFTVDLANRLVTVLQVTRAPSANGRVS